MLKIIFTILSLLSTIVGLVLILASDLLTDDNMSLGIATAGMIMASGGSLTFFIIILQHNCPNNVDRNVDQIERLETNFNVNDFLYPVYPDNSVYYGNVHGNIQTNEHIIPGPSAPPLYQEP